MREANTFWFSALSFSLAGAVYGVFFQPAAQASKPKGNKKGKAEQNNEKAAIPTAHSSALVKQIVVDCCDLLIPVELLNWMPTGDLVLGLTMVVSTLLTGSDIWARL